MILMTGASLIWNILTIGVCGWILRYWLRRFGWLFVELAARKGAKSYWLIVIRYLFPEGQVIR